MSCDFYRQRLATSSGNRQTQQTTGSYAEGPASKGWGKVLFSQVSVHAQEEGVPTMDGGRGSYLGQGEGYLTWTGGTYLGWGERGTYPGQVMLWASCRRTFLLIY